jgi:hypothetical protein
VNDLVPEPQRPTTGAVVGDLIEQAVRKLPPSSWIGVAGVGVCFVLIPQIPVSLPELAKTVLQYAFTIGAIISVAVIIRGVVRGT